MHPSLICSECGGGANGERHLLADYEARELSLEVERNIAPDQVGVALSAAASRRSRPPQADTGDSRGAECRVGLISTTRQRTSSSSSSVEFTIFSIAAYAQQTRARGNTRHLMIRIA